MIDKKKSVAFNENGTGLFDKEAKSHLIDKELIRLFPKRTIQRVLFVAPPDVDISLFDYASGKRGRCYNYPMYGAGIIANYLRKDGIDVHLVNLNNEVLKACRGSLSENNYDYDQVWKDALRQSIEQYVPDIVGVTCMFTQTHQSTVLVCREIKRIRSGLPVALGGVHITNCCINGEQSQNIINDFSQVDLFFLFEAELAFRYFVQAVNGTALPDNIFQVYFNCSAFKPSATERMIPGGEDLNVIPAYDLMNVDEISQHGVIGSFNCLKDKETRFATILSNRGCRGMCTFCSVRNFNGKGVRVKSIQTIIDELLILKNEYGIGHVMWLDDDLLFDHKRVLALFNEMVRQDVGVTWDCTNGVLAVSCTEEIIAAAAESGCIGLNIGMESGNPETLKRIKKPGKVGDFLKAAEVLKKFPQINARVFLIIGFPEETYSMLLDTFNVAMEMDLDWYNITTLQQLPNTPIFENMVQLGLINDGDTRDVRYNTGPYGKKREMMRNKNYASLCEPFEKANLDKILLSSQLESIWMYMNFHLNFKRLLKLNNPVKLKQQLKYLAYVTDLVAPDDPFPMYFYGYLQKKVLGAIDPKLLARLETTLDSSEYWRNYFKNFNLSPSTLS
ncbi:MAG: radical SAM protein [Candidatus Brocadiales bacterium]|nr:radical SAM protein [Candidatus Brocadiales bacterium]